MMNSQHRFGLAVTVLLALSACSSGLGPSLSSVPATMPSLDNDRAQIESDIQDSRVSTLRDRMKAMKEGTTEDLTINDAPDTPTALTAPIKQGVSVKAQAENPTQKVTETVSDTAQKASAAFEGFKTMAAEPEPVEEIITEVAEAAPAPTAPAYPAPASTQEEVKRKLADVFVSRDTYSHYLGAIKFSNGQREMTQKDMATLSTMVERLLQKNAKGMFVVQGFSSFDKNRTSQSDFANLKLSLKRAEVVRDALVFMGVERENIHLEAHGIDNPYNLEQPNRRALLWFQQ